MVSFKSIPAMFEKEKCGVKPNTVRDIDMFDERFTRLIDGDSRVIRIENSETGESFQRPITDVTVWKDLMMISWKHEGGSK